MIGANRDGVVGECEANCRMKIFFAPLKNQTFGHFEVAIHTQYIRPQHRYSSVPLSEKVAAWKHDRETKRGAKTIVGEKKTGGCKTEQK